MALKVDPNKIRRLSLSEQLLEKAVASYGADVIRYHMLNKHCIASVCSLYFKLIY